MTNTEALRLLLIEDDLVDVRAVRRAMANIGFQGHLHVAHTAEAAMHWFEDVTARVGLVLMDLNLPEKSGHEFLAELRNRPDIHRHPVVVLTSSDSEEDIRRCFAAAVSGYFVKSLELAQLESTLRSVLDYWQRSHRPAGDVRP